MMKGPKADRTNRSVNYQLNKDGVKTYYDGLLVRQTRDAGYFANRRIIGQQ